MGEVFAAEKASETVARDPRDFLLTAMRLGLISIWIGGVITGVNIGGFRAVPLCKVI